MHPVHLMWIIPLTFTFGVFAAALLAASKRGEENMSAYRQHKEKGRI